MKKIILTLVLSIGFPALAAIDIPLLQRQLAKSTGLPIHFRPQNPPVSWKVRCDAPAKADEKQLARYLAMVSHELGKYPKSLLRKANIKSIAIVKSLSVGGQLRSAMPDYQNEVLYLDFIRGNHAPVYQAHCMHHEFFHLLEQELNGSADFKDPEWGKLNPRDFKYGQGGRKQRGDDNFGLVHPHPGFINRYSMSGLEEDKAEIYAALFVSSERKKIMAMAVKDLHLKAKIEMMIGILRQIDPHLPRQLTP